MTPEGVVVKATHDDAMVLMALMSWGSSIGLEESLSAIFQKDTETAPMDDSDIRTVLTFGETAGALVKHDVLNVDLFRDVFWVNGLWAKVSHHALAARKEENEPSLYENFEALITT